MRTKVSVELSGRCEKFYKADTENKREEFWISFYFIFCFILRNLNITLIQKRVP